MSEKKRFEPVESDEREPVTVDQQDGWKFINKGMLAETTGLGPCFGVIAYDEQSKKAIVGHFVDPRVDDFKGMLAEAKKRFKNLDHVKIYVGGGSPNPQNAPEYTDDKAKRVYVKDMLQKNGFQHLKINYHNSDETTSLKIDTKTGDVEFDTDLSPFQH